MSDSFINTSKLHAIRNDDESIWINFSGDIPRVGDEINVSLLVKELEIDDDLAKKKWIVYKVLWFVGSWRIEPHPSPNMETTIMSEARVYIKEFI